MAEERIKVPEDKNDSKHGEGRVKKSLAHILGPRGGGKEKKSKLRC